MLRRAIRLRLIGGVEKEKEMDVKREEERGKWTYSEKKDKKGTVYGKEKGNWKSQVAKRFCIPKRSEYLLHHDVQYISHLRLYKGNDQSDK